jgi:hypothetical protein
MAEEKMNWRLVVGEGLVSLIFSLAIATGGSIVAYRMFASLAEQDQTMLFGLTAPHLAALVYGIFFCIAMLALTRLRVHQQAFERPGLHWLLALFFYGLLGLAPGLIFWLLFLAADRPGI